MDNNKQLTEQNNKLIMMCTVVSGNESLFDDIFTKAKEYSSLSFKALAAKSLDAVVKGLRNANSALVRAYGTNEMRINNTKGHLRLAVKEDNLEGVKLSKAFLEEITSTGKVADVFTSIDALIKALSVLDKHRLELETYYQKELSLFEAYKKVKTTEDAVKVIRQLDELRYPDLTLGHKTDTASKSDHLPGGKMFVFVPQSQTYKLMVEEVNGETTDRLFSPDEVLKLLDKMKSLDSVYKACHKGNDHYISYLNKYNTVVKEAFNHIDGLKGDISNSLVRDLMSRLEGNLQIFSFYTGFLPKVMNYVDSYMVNTTNYLSKQFN